MGSTKSIHEISNIDKKWPSEQLVDSIGFQTKAGNRTKDYLRSHGIEELSIRELMGLFLPPASNHFKSEDEFWESIPIRKQPQFGIYLYDSALLSLTEAELGSAFREEWMARVYSLKLHELRHMPGNQALRRKRAASVKLNLGPPGALNGGLDIHCPGATCRAVARRPQGGATDLFTALVNRKWNL